MRRLPPGPAHQWREIHWMSGSYIPASSKCKERDIAEFLADLAYIAGAIAVAVMVVMMLTKI